MQSAVVGGIVLILVVVLWVLHKKAPRFTCSICKQERSGGEMVEADTGDGEVCLSCIEEEDVL